MNNFRKYIASLAMMLLLCVSSLYAQVDSHTLTGVVKDESGEMLIGASVVVANSTRGVVSDLDGKFSISVNPNDELTFSYIGYKSETVKVGNRTSLNVILFEDVEAIDEVVVLGYGHLRRSDVPGAISTVKIDEHEARAVNNIESLIQGRATGVEVFSSDGAPGASVSVNIRGTTSLTGSTTPLYVVDGVILSSPDNDTTTASGMQSTQSQSGLTGINTSDIASIEILKDASATAIYGSLGANGVVLITTKTGASERTSVQYSGTTTFSTLANERDVLSLDEYANYYNEGKGYSVGDSGYFTTDGKEDINWQEDVSRLAFSQKHAVTISGRNEKVNYYISGGYQNTEGVIKSTGAKQGDLRLNLDYSFNKKFKIGTRTSASYSDIDMTLNTATGNASNGGLIRQMVTEVTYIDNTSTGVYVAGLD